MELYINYSFCTQIPDSVIKPNKNQILEVKLFICFETDKLLFSSDS